MSLNGTDTSSWQAGIDFSAIPGLDFSICKATQGTHLSDSHITEFHRQVKQLLGLGKLAGAYHYMSGQGSAEAEADYFLSVIDPYVLDVLIAVDYEKVQNAQFANIGYLERLCQRIEDVTGVKPVVYSSLSMFPWDLCKAHSSGQWVAQYATTGVVNGFQETPWNEGAYSCAIRQYSGNGRLTGYSGAIDLDKAYMTREAWGLYANPKGTAQTGEPETPVEVDTGTYHIEGDITITKK